MKLVLVLAGLGAGAAVARAEDVQLWVAAGFEQPLARRLTLKVEPQLRLEEDLSRLAALLGFVGARYRAADWLRAGAGYRAEYERNGDDELVLRHLFVAELSTRARLGRTQLSYRLRLQEQLRPGAGDFARTTLRNQVALELPRWRRLTPAASLELFHALGDFDGATLDKLRLTTGVKLDGKAGHNLEVFYRLELPQDDATEPSAHILGLTYLYD